MAQWDEYTQKSTPEDADTLMIKDTAAGANKRTPFSGVWNWILNKLSNAEIAQLETSNKTVIGSLNELNSKSLQPLVESVSVTTSKLIDSSPYASNVLAGEYPEGFTRSNCIPIAVGGLRGDNRWFFGFQDSSYQEQYAVTLEDGGVRVYRFAEDASNVNGSSVNIYVYLLKYTD